MLQPSLGLPATTIDCSMDEHWMSLKRYCQARSAFSTLTVPNSSFRAWMSAPFTPTLMCSVVSTASKQSSCLNKAVICASKNITLICLSSPFLNTPVKTAGSVCCTTFVYVPVLFMAIPAEKACSSVVTVAVVGWASLLGSCSSWACVLILSSSSCASRSAANFWAKCSWTAIF